ncbi:MAG: hypothetical protein K2U26_02900 [Cyclobacteriaceae bacterium]|nr:hypothetical protein [Cyclobacteriaceae bacterium]
MRTIQSLASVALIFAVLLFNGCKKDDPAPARSRDIRFEVSGNFTGKLDATFITASGGATNEDIPSLPWSKSITYASSVSGTTITIGGGGGVAGQTVTVKVFAGNKEVSSTPATANSSGIVVVVSPTYVF